MSLTKTWDSMQRDYFIDNSNIKSSSLNRSKFHLNKSGAALLTKNFAKFSLF